MPTVKCKIRDLSVGRLSRRMVREKIDVFTRKSRRTQELIDYAKFIHIVYEIAEGFRGINSYICNGCQSSDEIRWTSNYTVEYIIIIIVNNIVATALNVAVIRLFCTYTHLRPLIVRTDQRNRSSDVVMACRRGWRCTIFKGKCFIDSLVNLCYIRYYSTGVSSIVF